MNASLNDSQTRLQMAGLLISDAKSATNTAQASTMLSLAKQEIDAAAIEIERAQLQAAAAKVGTTHHSLTRLRGILSYGESHGGLPREESELLSRLRSMPALDRTEFCTEPNIRCFSWLQKNETEIFALADQAMARRSQSL